MIRIRKLFLLNNIASILDIMLQSSYGEVCTASTIVFEAFLCYSSAYSLYFATYPSLIVHRSALVFNSRTVIPLDLCKASNCHFPGLQPLRWIMANDTGIYVNKPNGLICIVAASLFDTSALYHLFQMTRRKTWFYIPLAVGLISKLARIR